MEIITRIFPYSKTLAGIKATLAHVPRLRDQTADAGLRVKNRLPSARPVWASAVSRAANPVQQNSGAYSKLIGVFGFSVFAKWPRPPTDCYHFQPPEKNDCKMLLSSKMCTDELGQQATVPTSYICLYIMFIHPSTITNEKELTCYNVQYL